MLPGPAGTGSPLPYDSAIWIAVAAIIGLAVLMMALAALVIAHHMVSDRNRRLNRQRFERAAGDLAPSLIASSGDLMLAVEKSIARNGMRATALVLRKSRQELKGAAAARITAVLEELGVITELVGALRSRREWKREHAARALGECGGSTALEALSNAASDPAPTVRRAARESLLALNESAGIAIAISSFLQDLPRRAGWRRTFYSRLSSIDPIELLRLVRSGSLDHNEVKLAMEALGDAGAQAAISIASGMLVSDDAELRATAVRVIGKLDRGEFTDQLVRMLEDDEWYVRAAVARSLEWMLGTGDQSRIDRDARARAIAALAKAMSDRAWWVRANSSRALARAGRSAREMLFSAAEGSDPYSADAALAALAMVKLDPAERSLVREVAERRRAAPPAQPRLNVSAQ